MSAPKVDVFHEDLDDERTEESMATPSSAKAAGTFQRPPQLEVTNCDFKFAVSSLARCNTKSAGNRAELRRTAWFRAPRLYSVQCRQVGIKHHLLSAYDVDEAFHRSSGSNALRRARSVRFWHFEPLL